VKHRRLLVLAGVVGAIALVASLSVAAASSNKPARTHQAAAIAAPKVPNAAAIKKKYGGQKITFVGDSVGDGNKRDVALAKRFSKDTGIKVSVTPHPAASDQSYAQLVRAFSQKSSSIDVAMIDVVWPGALAPYIFDM
jgi:ABC-type glycerol-3-phosphate transport system substrate-binding protein